MAHVLLGRAFAGPSRRVLCSLSRVPALSSAALRLPSCQSPAEANKQSYKCCIPAQDSDTLERERLLSFHDHLWYFNVLWPGESQGQRQCRTMQGGNPSKETFSITKSFRKQSGNLPKNTSYNNNNNNNNNFPWPTFHSNYTLLEMASPKTKKIPSWKCKMRETVLVFGRPTFRLAFETSPLDVRLG